MEEQIAQIPPPGKIEGPGPSLSQVHAVEILLREASDNDEPPLAIGEIVRRLRPEKISQENVRLAIDHLQRFSLVMEGSKGIMWTLYEDPGFWNRPVRRLR